jgi:hypothetical protein
MLGENCVFAVPLELKGVLFCGTTSDEPLAGAPVRLLVSVWYRP